jgi:hypothetical protein
MKNNHKKYKNKISKKQITINKHITTNLPLFGGSQAELTKKYIQNTFEVVFIPNESTQKGAEQNKETNEKKTDLRPEYMEQIETLQNNYNHYLSEWIKLK